MDEKSGSSINIDESHDLAALENAIHLGPDGDQRLARNILLRWLREKVDDPAREHSIADLIVKASGGAESSLIGPVVMRCVYAGTIPDTSVDNDVSRAIVSLCEFGTPELFSFLKIDPKAQGYLKFQTVRSAHQVVCGILAPMKASFTDTDSVLRSRKDVLGALNHSVIRSYCAVFDAPQIKKVVEAVYFKLKRVADMGPTLLIDIEDCDQAVADGKRIATENGSFLAREFLLPFLISIDVVLQSFLKSSRDRFTTSIVARFNSELQKRYPFHEVGRQIQISIPFKNSGPGLATSIKVTSTEGSESLFIANPAIHLGNVLPGDFSVTLDVLVIESIDKAKLVILMEWGEIGDPGTRSDIFELAISAQAANIDWSSFEHKHPYSTAPAEGEYFLGREEKVKGLAAKLLRSPMESFYITGQKRIGKTSLALAAIDFAKSHLSGGEIISSYNLWGNFACEDPRDTLNALGQRIADVIVYSIPDLRASQPADFTGSLSSLIRMCEKALLFAPNKRFVVVIDEFDEIHQELYLHGNLAETFFANLRALSRCKNICVVLVGGENMPYVMERQGQKLNNFSGVNLSYYARDKEWSDFRLMVQSPTAGVLNWYDDAVGEVFNITNGNPYFAKIICAATLRSAVRERDSDISIEEVKNASESEISILAANSFIHLWQDGIPKPLSDRDPEILLRVRVLVAIARCLRKGLPLTIPNIYESRGISGLSEPEAGVVLNDFVRRGVLLERDGVYRFLLPIFENWLVDVGVGQLAGDSLLAELASLTIAEELAATVRSDEIANLVQSWPTYRGMHIGSDEVRAWLTQVENPKDQRLLFELLKRVRVLSDVRVREMLEHSFAFLRPLPEFVIRKRSDRRKDVVITYVDGEGKSGQSYASNFAEANRISGDCIFPPGEFDKRMKRHIDDGGKVHTIVIVDDLVGTGKSLIANLEEFMQKYENDIPEAVAIRVISLFATAEGQKRVLQGLQKFGHSNIDFRPCELLTELDFAFPETKVGWESSENYERSKALCVELGRRVYKQNPVGYGGKGLLLVFPTNAPNNSLPILHSQSRAGNAPWKPLFLRVTH